MIRLYPGRSETVNVVNATQVNGLFGSRSADLTKAEIQGSYGSPYVQNLCHANWIIYRLTDIMLLKAEALCQELMEGSDNEVVAHNTPILEQIFTLVNAVNKRSVCQNPLVDTLQLSDYNSKGRMEELVLKERQRELMFEGKRWFDLVRRSMRDGNTEVLTQAAQKREGINSQYVQSFFGSTISGMYAIFWPYNDEETKVNLTLAAQQNPAFGTGESNIQK